MSGRMRGTGRRLSPARRRVTPRVTRCLAGAGAPVRTGYSGASAEYGVEPVAGFLNGVNEAGRPQRWRSFSPGWPCSANRPRQRRTVSQCSPVSRAMCALERPRAACRTTCAHPQPVPGPVAVGHLLQPCAFGGTGGYRTGGAGRRYGQAWQANRSAEVDHGQPAACPARRSEGAQMPWPDADRAGRGMPTPPSSTKCPCLNPDYGKMRLFYGSCSGAVIPRSTRMRWRIFQRGAHSLFMLSQAVPRVSPCSAVPLSSRISRP